VKKAISPYSVKGFLLDIQQLMQSMPITTVRILLIHYRPITIVSCLGKLFTAILNARLNDYTEEFMILKENQSGFRQSYSTLDNIFSILVFYKYE
jgi:hypothetical protein